MNDKKWYALYVRSRFEKKVDLELIKKDVECFLPLLDVVRVWSDRRKKVQVPLFAGYVFVKIDLRERLRALEVDGVVGLVGIRSRPSAIPDEQIEWIRIVLGHPESLKQESYVSIGEKVEVVAGPFKGIRGIVTRFKSITRVVITLESISQAVSIEVPSAFLESLSEASHKTAAG